MHWCPFFAGVTDRIDQMMGNLFYEKVPPSEINAMGYAEMQYWDGWHKLMEKAKRDAINA